MRKKVERTAIGKHLPVYTDFLGSGTKVVTILRKISGDVHVRLIAFTNNAVSKE